MEVETPYCFTNPEWVKIKDGKLVLSDDAPPKAVESFNELMWYFKDNDESSEVIC